jgi:sugar phosphate isomerase/epimerase
MVLIKQANLLKLLIDAERTPSAFLVFLQGVRVFVAATTLCYPHLTLSEAIEKLAHLEFSHIELDLHENGGHIKPSEVLQNLQWAYDTVNATRRLTVVALNLDIEAEGEAYYDTFKACCELAKFSKIVTLTVTSGEHGTPFNEEVERYKRLVQIADRHGVRVSMRSQVGHLSADPDTVSVICGHVKGLGLALDPSHYHLGHPSPLNYEKLLEYVHHVYLRDSTTDKLQVRVGQGVVDTGRLIQLLRKVNYNRSLCVDIRPADDPEIDHDGELRKMRLLLESLLLG